MKTTLILTTLFTVLLAGCSKQADPPQTTSNSSPQLATQTIEIPIDPQVTAAFNQLQLVKAAKFCEYWADFTPTPFDQTLTLEQQKHVADHSQQDEETADALLATLPPGSSEYTEFKQARDEVILYWTTFKACQDRVQRAGMMASDAGRASDIAPASGRQTLIKDQAELIQGQQDLVQQVKELRQAVGEDLHNRADALGAMAKARQ